MTGTITTMGGRVATTEPEVEQTGQKCEKDGVGAGSQQ